MIFSFENVCVGKRGSDISSAATLREREQIKDIVSSTFSELDHIASEGVNHVVVESSMIDKIVTIKRTEIHATMRF